MENVVMISIVGTHREYMPKVGEMLCERHLVAGLTFNDCRTMYWQGGQISSHTTTVIRGITFYEKIKDIENVLPEDMSIVCACPNTYVNPKTERWLNESIGSRSH